jgi:hypothetical protein
LHHAEPRRIGGKAGSLVPLGRSCHVPLVHDQPQKVGREVLDRLKARAGELEAEAQALELLPVAICSRCEPTSRKAWHSIRYLVTVRDKETGAVVELLCAEHAPEGPP